MLRRTRVFTFGILRPGRRYQRRSRRMRVGALPFRRHLTLLRRWASHSRPGLPVRFGRRPVSIYDQRLTILGLLRLSVLNLLLLFGDRVWGWRLRVSRPSIAGLPLLAAFAAFFGLFEAMEIGVPCSLRPIGTYRTLAALHLRIARHVDRAEEMCLPEFGRADEL